MPKENQVISIKKLQYLRKTLLQVLSKPYKANLPLITYIIENFATISFLKIHQLHSMTLETKRKQIEQSQITFIKNIYEEQKQMTEIYRRQEILEQNSKKNDEIIEFIKKMDWKMPNNEVYTALNNLPSLLK